MISEFSFKKIIELDCRCEKRERINSYWRWFDRENTMGYLFL